MLLGLTTGAIYFIGTLYWITRVMVVYGGLSAPAAVLVNVTLVAYLSLFPAIFGMAIARVTHTGTPRLLMTAPFAWVATELGRAHALTGFPWVLLGYSQASVLPVAQLASLTGVYGISALVVSVNAALAIAAIGRRRQLRTWLPFAAAMLIVLAVAAWGARRMTAGVLTRTGEPLRVGLIQGNVEQSEKWDERRASTILDRYLAFTRRAIEQGAQLVVWPESAMPSVFGEDLAATAQVRQLARGSAVPMLIGSDQVQRRPPVKYYNSAILVRPDGSTGGVYHKMHLVPFGEYVPARHVFFFMSRLVEAVSDFSAGESATLLPVGEHRVSTAICYEIIYPDLVRQFVKGGSELITTITNDAWFGATSAPHQHFTQATLRAIENGRYLVRAANTGVSGIVDPYGRVTARAGLFESALIVGDVRFLQASTLYATTGDLFAYLCALATAGALLGVRRFRPRNV
jgi:apolipoprotein N-acyltransferase